MKNPTNFYLRFRPFYFDGALGRFNSNQWSNLIQVLVHFQFRPNLFVTQELRGHFKMVSILARLNQLDPTQSYFAFESHKVLNFLFKIPSTYFFKIQTFSFDEAFSTFNSNRITKRKCQIIFGWKSLAEVELIRLSQFFLC